MNTLAWITVGLVLGIIVALILAYLTDSNK
jgi:ABC-type phosphate/phosphonate transport system permease subunit